MIFSVIISEKGGAERREAFERTEINVGRVQGNDLMLPKGNVSKRHARLLYRDGRFIVTDLKSTNGTYVNGRKITQATIVREGDKIYVGDFVLRIEATSTELRAPDASKSGSSEADAQGEPSSSPSDPKSNVDRKDEDAPSERDPDISSGGAVVPGPPRLPGATVKPSPPFTGPNTIAPVPVTTPTPHLAASPKTTNSSVPPNAHLTPTPPPPRGVRISSNPPGAREPTHGGTRTYRTIIAGLIERASESFDFDQLAAGDTLEATVAVRLTSILQELATQAKASGSVPDNVTIEQLVSDAKRDVIELGPLGPLGPLLVDDDVTEIYIESAERVLAFRKSRKTPSVVVRTNEKTILRALERLTRTVEPLVWSDGAYDRRIPGGLRVVVTAPQRHARGSLVVLRKPQRSENAVLEDLVRNGMLSQSIATFLTYAINVRANVLVVGAPGSAYGTLMSALVNAAGTDERIIVLQDEDEITLQHPNALALSLPHGLAEANTAARTAARMRPDRLVLSAIGTMTADIMNVQNERGGCLLAATRALTMRQALSRHPTESATLRTSMNPEDARNNFANTFHFVIEVARMSDGRSRVVRIAEPQFEGGRVVPKDIFVFAIERTTAGGTMEGAHQATGFVPTLVEDLATRGIALDNQLFRRNPGK